MPRYQAKHRAAAPQSSLLRRIAVLGVAGALSAPVVGALPAQATPGVDAVSTFTPAASNLVTVRITANVSANVRTGPGTQYPISGRLSRGTIITGTYHNSGWFRIAKGRYVSRNLIAPVDRPAPPPAPGEVTGAQVLAKAAQYEGTPYVYGGSTPNPGFDCSGYTSYVFDQLGIDLPRSAAAQRSATGSTSSPRPGDLVFFGSPAYHVGIYAGNGMLWDAGNPSSPVRMRDIWRGHVTYGTVPGVVN